MTEDERTPDTQVLIEPTPDVPERANRLWGMCKRCRLEDRFSATCIYCVPCMQKMFPLKTVAEILK